MAKEWILNSATNRFQFNFSKNVGSTSKEIRKCAPKSLKEWRQYYYRNVHKRKELVELGKRLYIKISEVLVAEIDSITEKDCVDYIIDLVIKRTFDGYQREINTIYGQLQDEIKKEIKPASDEWDRLYNVDFYIKVNKYFIGLQIKPVSQAPSITEIYKEQAIQSETHNDFRKKFGGKVFYIYSSEANNKKSIVNLDVIDEIKNEVEKLSKM